MMDFDEYYEAEEPGRRERAFDWATAIGLQQVDGLSILDYLIKTARRSIEGEIIDNEARRLVDEYYEMRLGHEEPTGHQEADKVVARMNQLIHAPVFGMMLEFLLGLHSKIFEGVFNHVRQIRDVELLKREWVLNGDSGQYEASLMVERSLEKHFEHEVAFKYKGISDDAFVSHFAAFVSRLWQIHPFREGNTRTTVLLLRQSNRLILVCMVGRDVPIARRRREDTPPYWPICLIAASIKALKKARYRRLHHERCHPTRI